MTTIGTRKMLLECVLTEEELTDRRDQLVQATKSRELREHALQSFKDSKKAEEKVYEADILHIANEAFRLARVIERKSEARDVVVEDVLEEGSNVACFRTDTGEQIGVRPATAAELQRGLPL